MQRLPFTKKRTVIGIALIVAGLVIQSGNVFWRGFQAPLVDQVLFISVVFIGCSTIILGGAVIAGMHTWAFLKGLSVFGLWAFAVVLPILLLRLPEEITALSISFSFLPFILLYRCYVELNKRHLRSTEKEESEKHGSSS